MFPQKLYICIFLNKNFNYGRKINLNYTFYKDKQKAYFKMKTWIVTGAASGIGKGIALAALKHGEKVVVTSRSKNKLKDLVDQYPNRAIPKELDLTKTDSMKNFMSFIQSDLDQIDVLVNNAGYGYLAAVEEGKRSELRKVFDTNLFGPVDLTQAVLPIMRKQNNGAIINISSVDAVRGSTGSSFYAATKAALESISDGLEREITPFGIKVMIVEPGGFQTDFYASLEETDQKVSAYDQQKYSNEDDELDRKRNIPADINVPGDPMKAGEVIYEAIQKDDYPRRLLLGSDALSFASKELKRREQETQKWAHLSKKTDK